MQYGLTFPTMDPRTVTELAQEAEAAGWDGVFVWDVIVGDDAWITLAAVAMRTERVRIGTMLTPVSRRRPYKLANETATLDHLSNGRVILPVGLGAVDDENSGFHKLGEATDRKVRAKMLDEGLDILTGLWSGQPFSYNGEHYRVRDVTGHPSVQRPRIPICVVGAWPRPKSMQRVLRWDGVLPVKMNAGGPVTPMTPADLQEMKAFIAERRSETTSFDIVWEGETPGDDREKGVSIVRPLAEVGVTWWLENVWDTPWSQGGLEGMWTRVQQGPPRID